jgi:hypothetical protein
MTDKIVACDLQKHCAKQVPDCTEETYERCKVAVHFNLVRHLNSLTLDQLKRINSIFEESKK